MEKQTSSLDIRKYKDMINGREKQFTLVGETHSYNEKESEKAQELVREHQSFAYECSSERMSLSNILYIYLLAAPL